MIRHTTINREFVVVISNRYSIGCKYTCICADSDHFAVFKARYYRERVKIASKTERSERIMFKFINNKALSWRSQKKLAMRV